MASLTTIKVKSDDTSFGYIIINETDFSAAQHVRFEEPSAPAADQPPAADVPAVPAATAETTPADPATPPAGSESTVAGAFDAMSAKDAIAAVAALSDVEALTLAKAVETRVTVLKAIDGRIADLTPKA
jgi:hypothetical protein